MGDEDELSQKRMSQISISNKGAPSVKEAGERRRSQMSIKEEEKKLDPLTQEEQQKELDTEVLAEEMQEEAKEYVQNVTDQNLEETKMREQLRGSFALEKHRQEVIAPSQSDGTDLKSPL